MWQKILVGIGLDATQFEAGAKRVQSAITRLTGTIGSSASSGLKGAIAGAFSVGVVSSFVRSTFDAANRIQDLADQFELTTDQVQELDFAAKQVGSTFEDIGSKIDKMGKARADATSGDQKAIGVFQRLGVELEDLQDTQKTNLDLFLKIAESYQNIGGTRVDLSELFGKAGSQLASVLSSLQQNKGEGKFFSTADIAAIDKLTELYDKTKSQVQGTLARTIVGLIKGDIQTPNLIFNLQAKAARKLFGTDKFFADQNKSPDNTETIDQIRERQMRELIAQNAAGAFPGQGMPTDPMLANAKAEQAINDKVAEMAMKADEKRRAAIAAVNPRLDGFSADSLARMGGFVGGAGAVDPSISIATEGNRILRQIERHLEEIRQDTREGGNGLNGEFAP